MNDFYERTGKLPVLVVFAPTACGKTNFALDMFGKNSKSILADKAEIISADSMQVYKGMDIGTAKPDKKILEELPHHLININTPDQPFSVGDFVRCSDELCHKIYSKGKLPVVLGGTGFYIRNFICGLPTTPQADEVLRENLKIRLKNEGSEKLYTELVELDSISASRIHPNDHYRILRALEVCHASGRPRSSFPLEQKTREGYDFCTIILERDRMQLYERINARVDEMLEKGLAEEFDNLVSAGYDATCPGMQAIGYREFFDDKVCSAASYKERISIVRELIAKNSRHYAKRQYTFMRGIPGALSFPADSFDEIKSFLVTSFKTFGLFSY